jgi:predicted DCC family thiol-disulfide oxidoreductase YuxK
MKVSSQMTSLTKTPSSMTSKAPILIFYDGECPICQRGKAMLESADETKQFSLVPLQDRDTVSRFPHLKEEALRDSMHLVYDNGDTYTGAATYREIGKHIAPKTVLGVFLKLFSWFSRLPGMLPIAEWVYQRFANNRYKILPTTAGGCKEGVCELPKK